MSNIVGSIGLAGSTPNHTGAIAGVVPNQTVSKIQATTQKPSSIVSGNALSEKLVFNPIVGIVAEYVDSHGDIKSQNPSAARVAYLKASQDSQDTSSGSKSVKTA